MISIVKNKDLFLETLIVPLVQGEILESDIVKLAEELQLPKTLLTEQINAEKKKSPCFTPLPIKV